MNPAKEVEKAILAKRNVIDMALDQFSSPVQQFYSGATVLVTGGSGFLGKQLIEKLFRSCKIKKLFVLIRPKKGKTVEERLQTLLQDPVYTIVRERQPDFAARILPVAGDAADLKLGISDYDRSIIVNEVDVIFHLAATVRFDEPLKVATLINVRGTVEMIALAKECKKLRCFNHVSTAFAHATTSRVGTDVEEKFYPCPVPPAVIIKLAESIDEDKLNGITQGLLQDWPNTYTFTKAIAEEAVRTMAADLPVCVVKPPVGCQKPLYNYPTSVFGAVARQAENTLRLMIFPFRPSYVSYGANTTEAGCHFVSNTLLDKLTSSYIEPLPGWIDMSCLSGPMGLILGIGMGVLHVFYVKSGVKFSYAPVDYVNNAVIAACWDATERRSSGEADIPIYTISSSKYGMEWDFIGERLRSDEFYRLSTPRAVWFCYMLETSNKFIYWILIWLIHYIPAYIGDAVCSVFNIMPKGLPISSFVKLYTLIYKLSMVYQYFMINHWNFKDDNLMRMFERLSPDDKVIYNCDMETIDYTEIIKAWCIGMRQIIVKDGLKRPRYAYRKQTILKYANILFFMCYSYVIWKIIYFFYWCLCAVFGLH